MDISVVFCHFKTGKMSAYTVSQLIKYKGNHNLEIFICDNNSGDGSIEYLKPFSGDIRIFDYPKDKLQSHGCGYDMLIPHISNPFFITSESDSFPTQENWLDYYEDLINKGYDCAGSLLRLSGGTYTHPAGALFKKGIWEEAKAYCDVMPYSYFPNMAMHLGFPSHLMVHNSILNDFLAEPEDFIELADGYKPYSAYFAECKRVHYSPTVNPFHNGMGNRQEDINTFGLRTIESEAPTILLDGKMKLIKRVGAEPGQWLSWYHEAMGKQVFNVPTDVKWLPGKENRQQERTVMENGFTHLWGVSAYHGTDLNDGDVSKIKQTLPEQLYETLPEHQKITI
jgi:hypothetical protein